jgi:hypothetical protein
LFPVSGAIKGLRVPGTIYDNPERRGVVAKKKSNRSPQQSQARVVDLAEVNRWVGVLTSSKDPEGLIESWLRFGTLDQHSAIGIFRDHSERESQRQLAQAKADKERVEAHCRRVMEYLAEHGRFTEKFRPVGSYIDEELCNTARAALTAAGLDPVDYGRLPAYVAKQLRSGDMAVLREGVSNLYRYEDWRPDHPPQAEEPELQAEAVLEPVPEAPVPSPFLTVPSSDLVLDEAKAVMSGDNYQYLPRKVRKGLAADNTVDVTAALSRYHEITELAGDAELAGQAAEVMREISYVLANRQMTDNQRDELSRFCRRYGAERGHNVSLAAWVLAARNWVKMLSENPVRTNGYVEGVLREAGQRGLSNQPPRRAVLPQQTSHRSLRPPVPAY